MLVNRSGRKSSTDKVSQTSQHTAHKRAAVVGLAVAATASFVSVTFSRLHAEDTSVDNPVRPLNLQAEAASDTDLLKQGISQYKKGQFEDAKATLAQVNAANLSEGDQKKLSSAQADVEKSLEARADARATPPQELISPGRGGRGPGGPLLGVL